MLQIETKINRSLHRVSNKVIEKTLVQSHHRRLAFHHEV